MVFPQQVMRSAWLMGGLSILSLLPTAKAIAADFSLTIFHNNDGESALLADGDEGGIANFIGTLENLRSSASGPSITLSSGDNFLAGLAFEASQEAGFFYDADALSRIGYDAIALGNHDFDFGPGFFADFIQEYVAFGGQAPYLSANLDFSGSPLAPFFTDDIVTSPVTTPTIAKSAIIERPGDGGATERIGVVSAITPGLASISSPGSVQVLSDVQGLVQAQINELEAQGVNKIILISHLQGINEELALIPSLSGVDVVIAGGGDELLINDVSGALPSDQNDIAAGFASIFGDYPQTVENADGDLVPVVTTPGEYGYIGQLNVVFDMDGKVTSFNGAPVRILAGDAIVETNAAAAEDLQVPLAEAVAALEEEIVGTTEVFLNGVRESVRTQETNLGDLIADSLLWQAQKFADENTGVPFPLIGLQNGGGIRNSNTFEAGSEISVADTIDTLPFANFVSIVEGVDPAQLKALFENAYSNIEGVDGRFAQVAGVRVGIDVEADPFNRVVSVTLDDGTPIVENGQLVAGAPTIALATNDFSARGGDDYPLGDNPLTNVGVSYQQALRNYIEQELGGVVPASLYPEDPFEGDIAGGNARLFAAQAVTDPGTSVPEPASVLALLTFGAAGAGALRRRLG